MIDKILNKIDATKNDTEVEENINQILSSPIDCKNKNNNL